MYNKQLYIMSYKYVNGSLHY